MPDFREKIVEFVKIHGPVLPVQISKHIGGSLLFSSAILGELVGSKKLLISNTRIGSSPLYYCAGQEEKLSILYNHLANKEKEAYNLLKEKSILRDNTTEPAIRVALRNIKDFAMPLKVDFNGTSEIFWKWYLISNERSNELVKQILNPEEIVKEPEKIPEPIKEITDTPLEEKKEEITPKEEIDIFEPKKIRKERVKKPLTNEFFKDIKKFFEDNNIKVIASELIKNNKEIDYIVELPSPLGMLRFFVKAKDKTRVSGDDLILAQSKTKLPIMFLSSGELNKQAEQHAKDNGILFKKI